MENQISSRSKSRSWTTLLRDRGGKGFQDVNRTPTGQTVVGWAREGSWFDFVLERASSMGDVHGTFLHHHANHAAVAIVTMRENCQHSWTDTGVAVALSWHLVNVMHQTEPHWTQELCGVTKAEYYSLDQWSHCQHISLLIFRASSSTNCVYNVAPLPEHVMVWYRRRLRFHLSASSAKCSSPEDYNSLPTR